MAGGLLTVAEAARRLGLSRGTVYTMTQRGQLTRVGAGYRDLIPAAQVDALVAVEAGTAVGTYAALETLRRERPDAYAELQRRIADLMGGLRHG